MAKLDNKILQSSDKRASQRWLFLKLQSLFPSVEMVEDFLHEDLTRISGKVIMFRYFCPSVKSARLNIMEQHYKDLPQFAGIECIKLEMQKKLNH
jgi:hypothetical protein